MASLTSQQFVERWRNTELGERQSYQAHFMDLCALVGYETPSGSGTDANGNEFVFEKGLKKQEGGHGFADVYLGGHFAVEYKAAGKYKDLSAAYQQLLQYREKLNNPPLLVVTDIQTWEIHTNWPNTEKKIYKFTHEEIGTRTAVQDWLRSLFYQPERLHPGRNSEQVTAEAADVFRDIASDMREWQTEPERIAHFLTKLVFCLFAEDVSLLPSGPGGETGIFSEIISRTRTDSSRFVQYMQDLFRAMADGGDVLFARIPYFNGTLFDDVQVEELKFEALNALSRAAKLDWSSVEPAIFGTLFERSLDPAKRSQLGAHYTSREDILLIVDPVLMQPLEREWAAIRAEAAQIRPKYDEALRSSNRREQTLYQNQLQALRGRMLQRLREIKVLDPACGSGNFLYVALQRLMDMEKAVINDELFRGLVQAMPEVHPRQMYGIEKDPIAHALASIVVWIGFIQWRQNNGYIGQFKEPILEDLHGNIACKDAILTFDADGQPIEPDWPAVDVIVGNPPFLGGKKMRGELGDEYVEQLRRIFTTIPAFTDLVGYWFERSRKQILEDKAKRVGLLATNSIAMGVNLPVLQNIKASGDIFMAWSDRDWILEGAAVRVAIVGFDDGSERHRILDGNIVPSINSDLTSGIDLTIAKQLFENSDLGFIGVQKSGPFDISREQAHEMMKMNNLSGLNNTEVIRPLMNGSDLVRRTSNRYIIDFGVDISEDDARKYEAPFRYIEKHVIPARTAGHFEGYPFWLLWNTRPAMRAKLKNLTRYIVTPTVAKHRLFVWLDHKIVPDKQLVAIARDDDYFFGVLHSRIHEVWSLRMGTWLGKGNDPRYTPTTTFETFPFPFPPGQEDWQNPHVVAIGAAARQLHEERDAWLNPAGSVGARDLQERTLTNLYNALNVWRGLDTMKTKDAAGNFAPRLDELHKALDAAVCAAYGWPLDVLADEEAILSRLLALNLARAGE